MNSALLVKFREAKKLIEGATNILLIAHKKPDGDTTGSTVALKLALDQLKKKVTLACVDDFPEYLHFLPEIKNFKKEFNYNDFDLIITLDCGASYMTAFEKKYPEILTGDTPLVNIDHHPSNDNFGRVNIVSTEAAATSIIIFYFLGYLENIRITRTIATCLLTGLYTDTGSFMHSNTDGEVLTVASKLLSFGATQGLIVKNVFKTTPINTLKLWGRVLENLKINEDGITMSAVTEKDFEDTNTMIEDLSGVIDLVNSVPGSKFSVLLSEDDRGNVKGSFRTQNDGVNLSEVAGVFGGGGHKKAAGFTLPGRLKKEVRWRIV